MCIDSKASFLGISISIASLIPCVASADHWNGPLAFGVQATHMIQLKSGNVLLWDNGVSPGNGDPSRSPNAIVIKVPPGEDLANFPADLDDPKRENWIEQVPLVVPGVHANLFCSAHIHLDDRDGSVFVTGGDRYHYRGIQRQWLFKEGEPSTWTRLPDMSLGKWYPEPTMLPGGSIVVSMGSAEFEAPGLYPEETPSRSYEFTFLDMTTLGTSDPVRAYTAGVPFQRTEWYWQETTPQHIYFPSLFPLDMTTYWAAGSRYDSRKFNLLESEFAFDRYPAEPDASYNIQAVYPSVAFFDLGDKRVAIKSGGSTFATNAVHSMAVINLDSPNPAWVAGPDMNAGRKNHFLMVLPTGELLAIGGNYVNLWDYDSSSLPQRTPEILTPLNGDYAAGTWRQLAPSDFHRPYHHTVSLLPDGRILCAGGEPTETHNGQVYGDIYTPDYAIGDRPSITDGPKTLYYDETAEISVKLPRGHKVQSLCMIPLSTATHARLFGQRYNLLQLKGVEDRGRGNTSVSFKPPVNEGRAQMGWYMLFLVDSEGKVSKSKVLRLTSRYSRQFPETISAINASSTSGGLTDILQGDGCVVDGHRAGEFTVTGEGSRMVSLQMTAKMPAACLPLKGLRIRLETQRVGGDIGIPRVFAGPPGGERFELETVEGRSLGAPGLEPSLENVLMRRVDGEPLTKLCDDDGNIEITIEYDFNDSTLRVDEFMVGGWQLEAP